MQGNEPDVGVFQKNTDADKYEGGFDWNETEAGEEFWSDIIHNREYEIFYRTYPEYKKHDK